MDEKTEKETQINSNFKVEILTSLRRRNRLERDPFRDVFRTCKKFIPLIQRFFLRVSF